METRWVFFEAKNLILNITYIFFMLQRANNVQTLLTLTYHHDLVLQG